MASAENQDLVETFPADASHPTFGESVRVRGLNGCADYFDAFGAEELVEGVAEFRVAVVDDESEGVLVAELHEEVPRLLCDPASVRIGSARDVLDPPCRQRDEKQHVDPLQERGLDREESRRQARWLPALAGSFARMKGLAPVRVGDLLGATPCVPR